MFLYPYYVVASLEHVEARAVLHRDHMRRCQRELCRGDDDAES
jgi:hypothetical protein